MFSRTFPGPSSCPTGSIYPLGDKFAHHDLRPVRVRSCRLVIGTFPIFQPTSPLGFDRFFKSIGSMLARPVEEGSWRGNIIKISWVDVCFGAPFVFPALSRALPLFLPFVLHFLPSALFSVLLHTIHTLLHIFYTHLCCYQDVNLHCPLPSPHLHRPRLIQLRRSLAVLCFQQQRQSSV